MLTCVDNPRYQAVPVDPNSSGSVTNASKPSIFGQSVESLTAALPDQPKYRIEQIRSWLFDRGEVDPNAWQNVPRNLRERLAELYDFSPPEVVDKIESGDGTTKLLLKTTGKFVIETVVMRYADRTSLCVSSQVGCKFSCRFCQTGKLGFFRNLSAAEIIAQLYQANQLLAPEGRRVTHVVFMGMGEPLDNFEAVVTAVQLLTRPEHFGLSSRRVTVSTSGIAPKITELAKRVKCRLAISLHSGSDKLRTELMPINQRYPLAVLKSSLIEYQKLVGLKITMEYILIKDRNCDNQHARDLVRFIHGLKAKVNLIPFNPHPGLEYERPSPGAIDRFQSYLVRRKIPAPVRYSKGAEVSAACGQLAAKNVANLASVPKRRDLLLATT